MCRTPGAAGSFSRGLGRSQRERMRAGDRLLYINIYIYIYVLSHIYIYIYIYTCIYLSIFLPNNNIVPARRAGPRARRRRRGRRCRRLSIYLSFYLSIYLYIYVYIYIYRICVIHENLTHAQRDKWRCDGNLRMSF